MRFWFGGKELTFDTKIVDAGYATYRTVSTIAVPLSSLFPNHFERGPILITDSPHYSFAKAHLEGDSDEWRKSEWRDYIAKQNRYTPEELRKRESRFEGVIESASESPARVRILVAINPKLKGLQVVDGFHRLSAVAACGTATHLSCDVVSEIIA
jgi:hypothetical protein